MQLIGEGAVADRWILLDHGARRAFRLCGEDDEALLAVPRPQHQAALLAQPAQVGRVLAKVRLLMRCLGGHPLRPHLELDGVQPARGLGRGHRRRSGRLCPRDGVPSEQEPEEGR